MAMRIVWRSFALAALLVAAATRTARADAQGDKADQLFAEGRALLSSNLLLACTKFTESLHYKPAAIGTLLNLALCDERLGRIATAVDKFSEARDRAKEQGLTEHQRAAEEHIAALQPDVPHLAIHLTEQLPNTTVLVDDHVVLPQSLSDITVDPGERVIVVSAPDRVSFRMPLTIARAQRRAIFIPALARSGPDGSSRRRIGQITVAGGGALLATGVGVGLYARHRYFQQIENKHCARKDDRVICDAPGGAATASARSWGVTGTVISAAGVAVAAAGLYLWLTAPDPAGEADRKLSLVPSLAPDGIGVVAVGRF